MLETPQYDNVWNNITFNYDINQFEFTHCQKKLSIINTVKVEIVADLLITLKKAWEGGRLNCFHKYTEVRTFS